MKGKLSKQLLACVLSLALILSCFGLAEIDDEEIDAVRGFTQSSSSKAKTTSVISEREEEIGASDNQPSAEPEVQPLEAPDANLTSEPEAQSSEAPDADLTSEPGTQPSTTPDADQTTAPAATGDSTSPNPETSDETGDPEDSEQDSNGNALLGDNVSQSENGGTEEMCEHPSDHLTDLGFSRTLVQANSLNENEHELVWKYIHVFSCDICGMDIEEDSYEESETGWHIWDRDAAKTCVDCGAQNLCDHSNVSQWTDYIYTDDVVDNGDGTHARTIRYRTNWYCPDCTASWSCEDVGATESEAHTWDLETGNTCRYCGAENPCDHSDAMQQTYDVLVGDAVDNGNGTHTQMVYYRMYWYCPECGVFWGYEDGEVTTENREHTWDSKTGNTCIYCKAKNTCNHLEATSNTYDAPQFSAIDNGDGTHRQEIEWKKSWQCEECGATWYEYVKTTTEDRKHVWDATTGNTCIYCKAKNTCNHLEATQYAYETPLFGALDNGDGTHAQKVKQEIKWQCEECEATWYEYVKTITENRKHEWDRKTGNKCVYCDTHNPCDHSEATKHTFDISHEGALDNGDGTHTQKIEWRVSWDCKECGAYWDEFDRITTENREHEWDVTTGNICIYCDAKNPCDHSKATQYSYDIPQDGAVDNGDGTHAQSFKRTTYWRCPECEAIWGYEHVRTPAENREHTWDSETGNICKYCGAQNTCDHSKATRYTYDIPQDGAVNNGDGTHRQQIEWYIDWMCEGCGAHWWQYDKTTIENRRHIWDYETRRTCIECGAENDGYVETPTEAPATEAPTMPPGYWSTEAPATEAPTMPPGYWPTDAPATEAPTMPPGYWPTYGPTEAPTMPPGYWPTETPAIEAPATEAPTMPPGYWPTEAPATEAPTMWPGYWPTEAPATEAPTMPPGYWPTEAPATEAPTMPPGYWPTGAPATEAPTMPPGYWPTDPPTTEAPTMPPGYWPTEVPATEVPTTEAPTMSPGYGPTDPPTTEAPTMEPGYWETEEPTFKPEETLPVTPTLAPTDTPMPEPTDTPAPEPTDSPMPVPSDIPKPAPTDTPIPDPMDTPTPEPTDSPMPVPSDIPKPAPTDTPMPEPTDTVTPEPTNTPTPEPTSTLTLEPTEEPAQSRTPRPSQEPAVDEPKYEQATPEMEEARGLKAEEDTSMGTALVRAVQGIEEEYGAQAELTVRHADRILTRAEYRDLQALLPVERIVVMLQTLGFRGETQNALGAMDVELSPEALELIEEILARLQMMDAAEQAEFQRLMELYFPRDGAAAMITLEIETAGEATRYERYSFADEGEGWLFARLDVK